MKDPFFFLIGLSLLFIPLPRNNEPPPLTQKGVIEIDLNRALKTRKEFKLSQIVRDVDFIFMEDNPKCSMTGMTEFSIGPNFIMAAYGAMGPNTTHLVHLFNRGGRYLRSLGNEGKGPGEYLNLFKATMDPKEKFVVIADFQQRKLIKYELNGKFILEHSYGKFLPAASIPTSLTIDLSGDIYLYCQRPPKPVEGFASVLRFDSDLNYLGQLFSRANDDNQSLWTASHELVAATGHLMFWEQSFDTVYYVYPNKNPIPQYHLNIKYGGWPRDMLKDYTVYKNHRYDFITTTQVIDIPGFLLIGVMNKQGYQVIYDKKSGESFSLTNSYSCYTPPEKFMDSRINNDLTGFENMGLGRYVPEQNIMVEYQNPNYLLTGQDIECLRRKKVLLPEKRDQLLRYVQNCDGDEGQVVLLWHLKKSTDENYIKSTK